MTLEVTHKMAKPISVPYGPILDDIRRNSGFTDTRNRPDLASRIIEGNQSPALRDLLIDVATRCRYLSIGCDLGEHEEKNVIRSMRKVAGGYVHLCGFNYEAQETANYDAFCDAIASIIKPSAKTKHWRIEFHGAWIDFQFDGKEVVRKPSVELWFFAADETREQAADSREVFLRALTNALNDPTAYRAFA